MAPVTLLVVMWATVQFTFVQAMIANALGGLVYWAIAGRKARLRLAQAA